MAAGKCTRYSLLLDLTFKNTIMKLITLLCLLLSTTIVTTAQIKKGQFLVGGSISFESVKNEGSNAVNYKTTNLFISPNIGYFIIEKLAGGVRLNVTSYKQDLPFDHNVTVISMSPFVRYYFLPAVKKVNAFIDLGYLNTKTKFRDNTTQPPYTNSYTERSNGYSISAGPAIFLNDHVSLEFTVGYRHLTADNQYNVESSTVTSALGLQIHLGKLKGKRK
jgi:outer membrane protein W